MKKNALILGSTGLVGSIILNKLLDHPTYEKVIIVVRKKQAVAHPKLEQIITSFDSNTELDNVSKIDSIFSCLGTTRKKTPNLDDYRKIEVEIPSQFAQIGKLKDITKFHYISSVGADENSSNFYLKMKGEAEASLKKINVPILNIYQPSLLIGARKEQRLMEDLSAKLFPLVNKLLFGKWTKYKSMNVHELAQAIVNIDLAESHNTTSVYLYDKIISFSKKNYT